MAGLLRTPSLVLRQHRCVTVTCRYLLLDILMLLLVTPLSIALTFRGSPLSIPLSLEALVVPVTPVCRFVLVLGVTPLVIEIGHPVQLRNSMLNSP